MNAYRIGTQDVLEISVFKVPELSKVVQVSETGMINVALVGAILAGGRTAQEVEAELAKKLGAKYLQSPQVTVLVKEFNSQRVTIEGPVKKPGVYPLRPGMSLMQLIATSEGVDNAVASSTVVIFRHQAGKRQAARFDLDDIRAGSSSDPELKAGDMIVVDTSAGKAALNNVLKLLPLAAVFAVL